MGTGHPQFAPQSSKTSCTVSTGPGQGRGWRRPTTGVFSCPAESKECQGKDTCCLENMERHHLDVENLSALLQELPEVLVADGEDLQGDLWPAAIVVLFKEGYRFGLGQQLVRPLGVIITTLGKKNGKKQFTYIKMLLKIFTRRVKEYSKISLHVEKCQRVLSIFVCHIICNCKVCRIFK